MYFQKPPLYFPKEQSFQPADPNFISQKNYLFSLQTRTYVFFYKQNSVFLENPTLLPKSTIFSAYRPGNMLLETPHFISQKN